MCNPLATAFLIAACAAGGWADSIPTTDASGMRLETGASEPLMLIGLSILNGSVFEDRTFLEFDVSSLGPIAPETELRLWIDNWDAGGRLGVIDVFPYFGDGVVTTDDFWAGVDPPLTSVQVPGELLFTGVDVTDAVQDALDANEPYLGFRLSTETSDRFFLGGAVSLPEPILAIVPEPASFLLFGTTALLLARRRRRPGAV